MLKFAAVSFQCHNYLFIYLQGIPVAAEVVVPAANHPSSQTTETGGVSAGAVPGVPNSSPLNMFPQVKIIILIYCQKSCSLVTCHEIFCCYCL